MKNRFKNIIGLLISIVLAFESITPALASEITDESSNEQIIINLSNDEDFKVALNELDELAQEYYDYFEENGEFPNTDAVPLMTTNAAISALNTAGFGITSAAFAELASELGSIAGIGSALPAAVVVGIIIGITVYACSDDLSSTSINNLANNVSSVVTKVGNAITSNSSKAKSNAREAVITSVNYWKNLRKYHYFECTRISGYKGDGLGGIKVGDPLTEEEALARVLTNTKNNSDVFCTHADWAYELALLASDSGYPEFHFAHIDTSHGTKPYNLPHYHYLINGNNSNAHIFYEG